MPPITTVDGPSYGIFVVQERSRWDDVLQHLHGKVTFDIITPFGSKREIVEFNGADVLAYAQAIIAWANQIGGASSVPMLNGFTPDQQTYVASFTGPSSITPQTADQSDLGATVPAYVYDDSDTP